MLAKDFFLKVEKLRDAGCSSVKINIDGSPAMKLRHYRDPCAYASSPEELLLFGDLYPNPETYMYAQLGNQGVIELVDSNDREQHRLAIEDVSQAGDDIVITVRFVGTE